MSSHEYFDGIGSNQPLEYVDADMGIRQAREAENEDIHHPDYVDADDNFNDSDRDHFPSPTAARDSIASNGDIHGDLNGIIENRERSLRSYRPDRDRHRSSANRDYLKMLVNEERGSKQMRRVLTAAFDRLDVETRRAQEAERRALDIAQRFKIVNDARLSAQQEVNRVKEELHLYKLQLYNAQGEISRGSEILKDVEAQRDDAEAAAARARSAARRFKEQHLMTLAREEGRRQGYQEGVRRGYEEARLSQYRGRDIDANAPAGVIVDDGYGSVPPPGGGNIFDDLPDISLNLPSPPRGVIPLAPVSTVTEESGRLAMPPAALSFGAGAEGSRFRENIASPVPSTLDSLSGRPLWPLPPPGETPKHFRPPKLPNTAHSPHRPYTPLPDGYVPSADADNYIHIPPPHEVGPLPPSVFPPPSTALSTITSLDSEAIRAPPRVSLDRAEPRVRDYAYTQKQRSSPRSLAESVPSTTISQFDLLSSPRHAAQTRMLSSIPEVSTSMEMSPSAESRARSSIMPEPLVFPTPVQGPEHTETADNSRYSDPSVLDDWRRTTADELSRSNSRSSRGPSRRPSAEVVAPSPLHRSSSAGGTRPYYPDADVPTTQERSQSAHPRSDAGSFVSDRGHRSTPSGDVTITVQPPSGPSSEFSPMGANSRMLSPSSANNIQPSSQPIVSTVLYESSTANTPSTGMQFTNPVDKFPPRFIPARSGPSVTYQDTTSPSSRVPKHSIYTDFNIDRHSSSSSSADLITGSQPDRQRRRRSGSLTSSDALRSKTPVGRPLSAMGNTSASPSRSQTPNHIQYVPAPAPSSRSHTPSRLQYVSAPIPPGVQYPEGLADSQNARSSTPGNAGSSVLLPSSLYGNMSPRSSTSRLSVHQRSFSLNAGSTPAANPRPLSTAPPPQLRRVPSTGSISSAVSGQSEYKRYDRRDYADPAYFASTEDLQSPNTKANTRTNATLPGVPSPARSYRSLRD